MPDMRIAVIADVHGNAWALDAVLADIARQGIERIVDLGDSVYGPLDPATAARRLMAAGIPSVQGNEDRILFSPPVPAPPTLRYTLSSLPVEARDWLQGLPRSRVVLEGILACHGTPDSDETYLLEEVTPHGVIPRSAESILAMVRPATQSVILCGHSHVARAVTLPGGQLAVNPGSVGLQAYTDELPYPHRTESGSPHARYAVLWHASTGWQAEQHAVAYAWDAAAACAREHGRPDWAQWLATGCA